MDEVAADAVEIPNSNGGQDWLNAWHPPPDPPTGKPHGAAGVCLAGDQVVLISDDGRRWDLPAGRPGAWRGMGGHPAARGRGGGVRHRDRLRTARLRLVELRPRA
jgi:hypothetical protein